MPARPTPHHRRYRSEHDQDRVRNSSSAAVSGRCDRDERLNWSRFPMPRDDRWRIRFEADFGDRRYLHNAWTRIVWLVALTRFAGLYGQMVRLQPFTAREGDSGFPPT